MTGPVGAGRRWLVLLVLGLLGCREATAPPALVLLVTVDALRADVMHTAEGRRAMPVLTALAARASFAAPAVAASNWTVPALASLWTGLGPWRHGAIHPLRATLSAQLVTLPEALRTRGYDTYAFRSGSWLHAAYGWEQGLGRMTRLTDPRPITSLLTAAAERPRFVWVHLAEALPPFEIPSAGGRPRDVERVRESELDLFADPGAPPPSAAESARFASGYYADLARVDDLLGRLLAALERSPAPDWVVAVVGVAGCELGEHGPFGSGHSLRRAALEVPLVLDVGGRARRPSVPPPTGGWVAATRLYATLIELVGGKPPPAAAPSLLRAGANEDALSEHYLGNGTNAFSLLAGDLQVVRTVAFAQAQSDFFTSTAFGVTRATSRPPELAADAPLDPRLQRLLRAFDHSPPFSGRLPTHLALYRWRSEGGSEALEDPPTAARLDALLAARLRAFLGVERSAAEETRLRRRDARLVGAP